VTVLDVPFVPQSEDLCGGAAAAMVMRYWGARDVYASTFAPLVDRSAGGIQTSALTRELQRRQWTPVAGPGSAEDLARELGRGRPVITLIEDRPGRYHYVVVVAASGGKVVLHDPARAPSRVVEARTFEEAWAKTDRWMLVLLPPPEIGTPMVSGAAERSPEPVGVPISGGRVCASQVAEGVRLAETDRGAARHALDAAAAACPSEPAPWRELAGLDALESRWEDAARHARRAVANDGSDQHAWTVLATAEYVLHRDGAALGAWNHIGEPSIDLIDIKGLEATRYDAVFGTMGLAPGQTLTSEALRRAERQVRDLPAVSAARVTYHPLENGRAQVDASIVERARAPISYPSLMAVGATAGVDRQITASFANLSGGADLAELSWRWWANRPMIAASYAAPAPRWAGRGVWRFETSRETQTFGSELFQETRTRGGMEVSNWITDRVRLSGGAAIERWTDRGRAAAFSARIQIRPSAGRVVFDAGASGWTAARRFGTVDGGARWRSRDTSDGIVWLAASGYRAASDAAPASVWPGADNGHARDVLLRAHPLLEDGIITGGVFGRSLAFGSVEAQRWRSTGKWLLRIAPAVFVDVARATRGLAGSDARTQVDAGAGVRVSLFGMGILRVDVGHGVRDGRTALSIGWETK
jgi:Papain-like cysteine protease AvrRpt2